MKNLKMIFSILFLMLVTCQFHQVHADKASLPVYQNVISDISLQYNGAMLNGDITLDNGAIMHIIDYKTRDDNAINKWNAGDAVTFNSFVQKEKLILAIRKIAEDPNYKVEPYVIFDNINSSDSCLTIVEVKEKGKFVKLSDNSVWEFSYFNQFATEDWSVGERVLVSGNGEKNSYNFINLDVPVRHNDNSATATFVVD